MSDDQAITIQEQASSPLAAVSGGQGQARDLLAFANQLEAMEVAYKQIKVSAIKRTNENDWCNLGGKPYCQGPGWEKLGVFFKVSWRILAEEKIVEEDGHYMFKKRGLFRWEVTGTEIEAIGTRSSKDPFFKQYDYTEKDGKRIKVELSSDELLRRIDAGDVDKAAFTNLIVNGVSRILGLRNLTWEDLKSAGLDTDKISKVEYAAADMSGEAKDQKTKIVDMLTEMYGKNHAKQLEELTENTDKNGKLWAGVKDLGKCSEKKLNVVYGQIKTAYEAWQKGTKENDENFCQYSQGLLGIDSTRYADAVKAIKTAKSIDRVDELLAMANGIFSPEAVKSLSAVAKNAKEALGNAAF